MHTVIRTNTITQERDEIIQTDDYDEAKEQEEFMQINETENGVLKYHVETSE